MKNTEQKNVKKIAARILAIILAILMVTGMAYYTIYMLVLQTQDKDDSSNTTGAVVIVHSEIV